MIAAAICYRISGSRIQFLLVRTSDTRRWTFPKGHVEAGETAAEGAAREAREEAGASGKIETRPFTKYRYHEEDVRAFLLRVRGAPKRPQETFRTPTWFTPVQAAALLAVNRSPESALEHARVIDLACARLQL